MAEPEPAPPRTRLRQLLERPDARPRVGRAVASLLAVSVAALAAIGALIVWHLVRRGRLIREGLNPPRPVRWPDIEPLARESGPPAPAEPGPELERDREAASLPRDEPRER
jgi:hypothetical protein